MSKVKAINPLGGVANIPPDILEAQQGEIVGFKCAGAFVAPATEKGERRLVAHGCAHQVVQEAP
jgi:hypothetical protein